ncbi:hypothetical protein CVT91_05990 [Candidatus Atribacteria bacterium HGW-Atribacteria-1]|nr:MAG: hypothetical protein CVT91_05990 [Candidatus Atribacteria bacterium HGW-Atribacteria-1]
MSNKFTYFDFISYFIPGAMLIWSFILFAKSINVLNYLTTLNTFIDTLVFTIIAFVLGHFIQYKSRQIIEPKMKKKYWNGAFVSEQFLIKNNKFCYEIDRQKFLKTAREQFRCSIEELKELDSDTEEARKISHSIYKKAYSLINNAGINERATTANIYYNFFRGLSATCFCSALLFLVQSIIKILENWGACSWEFIKEDLLIPSLLMIFFFYLMICFIDRARQRGELHVEQTFNSMYVYYLGGIRYGKQS